MTGKYRSFAITISTKEDVEGKLQTKLVDLLKKQDYAFAVIEHDKMGVRHLHAQTWHDKGKDKNDYRKSFIRIIEANAPLSNKHSVMVKIAYNDDFYEDYLSKDIVEQLIDDVPSPEGRHEHYPSQEEQDKVMAKCNAADTRFHKMMVDFHEWWDKPPEVGIGLQDVAKFMADMMFKTKKYPVITDKKNRVNNTWSLYMYINSKVDINEFMTEEKAYEYKKFLEEGLFPTHFDH